MQGTTSFIFVGKLKALKKDLKFWNVQSSGGTGNRKKSLLEDLEVERTQEGMGLSLEELSRRIKLVSALERATLLEENSWWQKPLALWLKEGDQSTKFFHSGQFP